MSPRSAERAQVLRVLPGLMVVMLLGALDQTIMAPALPAVAGDLGGLDEMPVVLTAYLVAATVVMPVFGRLGDRFGRKPVLLGAIGLFMVGAVASGLAGSIPALVVARVVQGAGGGGLMIGAQAVLGEVVSPRERGRYLGLLGVVYVLAAVGGPIVGGLFIDHLSWRWIFAIYPPLGVLAMVAVVRTLRLPVPRDRPSVDYAGATFLATVVVAVILLAGTLGRPGGPAWLVPVLAVVALAAFAGWLVTARRAADPVLPLRLFTVRSFAIPTAISFLIGLALFGTVSYLPAYLQIAMGTSATQAGLALTCLMGGVITTMTVSGRLISRTGRYRRYPVIGTAMAAAGMALLALVNAATPVPLVLAILLLIGLGIGLTMQVMMLVAQNGVDHRDLGAATSTVTFLRQIGASVGVAVVGALITARFTERLPDGLAGLLPGSTDALSPDALAALPPDLRATVATAFGQAAPPVFGMVAPLLVVAFLLAVALPAQPLRDTAHVGTADVGSADVNKGDAP
ncbi:MAG: MFS transporter [Pseudonocardia sp.]|nr:MFS transporter [Pseudonocardia sp.]